MEDSEPLGHVAACSLPTPSTPTALSPVELALAFLPFFPGALPSTAQPLIEECTDAYGGRRAGLGKDSGRGRSQPCPLSVWNSHVHTSVRQLRKQHKVQGQEAKQHEHMLSS
jgi:hypothetical protein